MKNFVGIDLGTTNSAICSYNGTETRIWKSPEQNDVTPSAIFIDRRGNKYVGIRAYNMAPSSPDNAAMLFKRLMGTSTPVQLPAVKLTKTPEECSAEVLKTLFGYLPEEIRNNPDTGTVITVPAAFNQMQKDATMQAAGMAGIGKVALMQEPVAAVMSVMKTRTSDGMFLIYDLGGGTLDIAIAESLGGGVNLLAHGGIAMCGGRDFDRALFDNVVRPWLQKHFVLPDDLAINPDYKPLMRLAMLATEKAKIELSARDEAVISLAETEIRLRDLEGSDIYIDVPLRRDVYDKLIDDRVADSIDAARETLVKAGLSPHDLDRIVFIGGPTNYKPLRDKVSFELGIPGGLDVNPMTAVAEGASLFAESIDWSSQSRSRKNTRGQLASNGELNLSFNYIARTPAPKAKIVVQVKGDVVSGAEFQVDSLDTGWSSGRIPLKNGASLDVVLTRNGENLFKVFVFDAVGGPISIGENKISITRTAATVDAIPASHSIAIEVLDRLGGRPVLDYLVRSGDPLPKKGKKIFKSGEALKAGSASSLNFKLWEGEIEDRITDNRPIGVLKISGSDFEDGIIPAGSDLECEYEILDSGNIVLEISVPCIGSTFNSDRNFYSRQEGQMDYSSAAAMVTEEGQRTMGRLDEIEDVVEDPKLEQARQKLETALSLDENETEIEKSQEAMEKVYEAKKLLAQVRKEHLKEIRQLELDRTVEFFNGHLRQYARPSEENAFDNLTKIAQRAIERNDKAFENHHRELTGKNIELLWRQDWFVVARFNKMVGSPHLFTDQSKFIELVRVGNEFVRKEDIDGVRSVIAQLFSIQISDSSVDDMFDAANIIRG